MTTAAEEYAARTDARTAQSLRLYGPPSQADRWADSAAQFRFDPLRPLDANLALIASYLQPGDVLVDVGGGAGRVSLPLALLCQESVSVEPSPGMGRQFEESAKEAAIANARLVHSNWMEPHGVQGDVVFASDVTYFIREIVPFIQKMESACHHRVMITIWSEPPPTRSAPLFRLVYGEDQEEMCGQRHLLAVLWEMGVLPDVHVMPEPPWWEPLLLPSRKEAVDHALSARWLRPEDAGRARSLVEDNFGELFGWEGSGYRPLWRLPMRELLITWESN